MTWRYRIRRIRFWLIELSGIRIRFEFRIASSSLAERWRLFRRYQKRCSFCGRRFDWGYAPAGSWAEGDRYSCGCKPLS